MRVLHIITGLETGGAERSLFNLLDSNLRTSFDHQVLSLSDIGFYGPKLRAMGLPVYELNLSSVIGLPNAILSLRKLVRQIAPELIQGWMYHGNMAASIAAALAVRPVKVAWNVRQSLYDISTEKQTTQWLIRMLRTISRKPQAVIYNSFQSKDHHEAFGFSASKSLVIANGFDTDRWRPDLARRRMFRDTLGLADTDLVVGFVGRFHSQKDVPTFLKACALAMEQNPKLHAVLVGDGLTSANTALSALYSQIPGQRLHALGKRDAIEDILPGFDLFCLTSSSEAFPNVLGEAMSSGLPCIATDVGDCARLLGSREQIMAVRDFESISDAMCAIASMSVEHRAQIGEASRKRISNFYSLDVSVAAYQDLYSSLANNQLSA